jgi:hypothetical protein
VRAIPVDALDPGKRSTREPSDAFGSAPGESRIEYASRVAGFDMSLSGRRRVQVAGVTPEQNRAFVRALWAKR